MSTALILPLITVEEFFVLPEPQGDFTYELHFGELVKVGRPNKKHFDLQIVIRDVLVRALGRDEWLVEIEMPYGLTAGYDARAADVGVALRRDWDAVPDEGYLIGSPTLVVQVKSRSNRDSKMEEDAIVHITHGAAAVLIVKPESREIVAFTSSARTVHSAGQRIALPSPISIEVDLSEVFARLT